MKRVKQIPSLRTDQEAAGYWDAYGLAAHIEDTREDTIRFVRRPKGRLTSWLTGQGDRECR